jgi:hypothetical protein
MTFDFLLDEEIASLEQAVQSAYGAVEEFGGLSKLDTLNHCS